MSSNKPSYQKQPSISIARPSDVQNSSAPTVQYTPFITHASLDRVKSDDPWGVKTRQSVQLFNHEAAIVEEDSAAVSPSVHSSQMHSVSQQVLPTQTRKQSLRAYSPIQIATIPRRKSTVRIHADWLFFIKPMGILMVLEIGLCGIAVLCSDYSSIFQAIWKTWFIMLNFIVIVCTLVLFLLHLCRFSRGNVRVKMIFLLLEAIYDVMTSLALLASAVAYLRVSVDPLVVIIAGVCALVSSIMYGISAFFTFTARRNYKYNASKPSQRHRVSSFHIEDLDDEEYEQFNMLGNTVKQSTYVPSKRVMMTPKK